MDGCGAASASSDREFALSFRHYITVYCMDKEDDGCRVPKTALGFRVPDAGERIRSDLKASFSLQSKTAILCDAMISTCCCIRGRQVIVSLTLICKIKFKACIRMFNWTQTNCELHNVVSATHQRRWFRPNTTGQPRPEIDCTGRRRSSLQRNWRQSTSPEFDYQLKPTTRNNVKLWAIWTQRTELVIS